MGETLNFPRDTERRKYFVPECREHGAKLELRTLIWLIERYTSVGDRILDPMSGIGTIHYAATMGRYTVAIELDGRFAEIQRMNIEKLGQTRGFTAITSLMEMDCRRALPFPQGFIDTVIFSPPYGNVMKGKKSPKMQYRHVHTGYGDQEANIGNMAVYPMYLEAMKVVYKLCNQSLKLGSLLILIVKDYVEGGERKHCSRDNLRVCLESGFILSEWHKRYTDPRIYQIISRQKREEAGTDRGELHIDYEDILVFKKSLEA